MITMTVIKNGKYEEREIAYVERPTESNFYSRLQYPKMTDSEGCSHTIDGQCYVYDLPEYRVISK